MADSRQIMADLRRKADRVVRRVAVDALDSAVSLTPVDTGEAAGNWRLSKGGADTKHDSKRRKGEALTEGRVKALSVGVGDKIVIATRPASRQPFSPATS